MNATRSAVTALMVMVCAGGVSPGQDMTRVYRNSFESSADVGSEWSVNTHTNRRNFSGFLGRLSYERVTLRLATPDIVIPDDPDPVDPDPDEPDIGRPVFKKFGRPVSTRPRASSDVTFSLRFDLYLIDSWDGDHPTYGDDRLIVDVNGRTLFDESLSTHINQTNFRDPDQWGTDLGYGSWNDAIYRDIQLLFTLEEGEEFIELGFFGTAAQGFSDESWGIDNVRLDYFVGTIPSPAGLSLLVCAGAVAGARRRR